MFRKIEKCSPEWMFLNEFWKFRQDFYEPDSKNYKDAKNDKYYDEMIQSGSALAEKYKNEPFAKFAQNLVVAHMEDVRERCSKNVNT